MHVKFLEHIRFSPSRINALVCCFAAIPGRKTDHTFGSIALATLALSLLALPSAGKAAGETLIVYTYESFTADWGPGPQVEKAFEAECNCDLQFVSAADGVALLNRIRLEGKATRAEIVLGLDTNLISEARASGHFVPHGIDLGNISVPGGWTDDIFVPFDYGYFAVIYDSSKITNPPASLRELVEGDPAQKIIIEDPRTSTPGLGLLLWMKAVYGDKAADAWSRLKERVLTVTPGWSEAYGLFINGEAPMVFSYTTSPAYHIITDGDDRYRAASFAEGHYLQVEVAGMTATGAKNPLSQKFLTFMTGPAFQDVIPQTNWMLPAGKTDKPLNPAFDGLVQPSHTLQINPDEGALNRKVWIDEWLAAMSR